MASVESRFLEQWALREKGFNQGEDAEVGLVEKMVAVAELTPNDGSQMKTQDTLLNLNFR